MFAVRQGRDDQRTMKATRYGHVDGVDRFVSQDFLRVGEPWGVNSLRESASLRCRATHDARDFNAFLTSECHVRARMGRAHAACAEDRESHGLPAAPTNSSPIRPMVGSLHLGPETTL